MNLEESSGVFKENKCGGAVAGESRLHKSIT